jgi:hypothetical protein
MAILAFEVLKGDPEAVELGPTPRSSNGPRQPHDPSSEREKGAERQGRKSADPHAGEPQAGGSGERRQRGEEDHLRQRHDPDPSA